MLNGQKNDFLPVKAIQDDLGSSAELNHPFAKFFWQVLDGASHLRMFAEQLDSLPDCLDGAHGRAPALGSQRIVQPDHIEQALRCPLQAWHSGASEPSPASSLASHALASSRIRPPLMGDPQ